MRTLWMLVPVVAFLTADLINPQYDPLREPVSRYVNGTAGWLITVAILAMGLLTAFALYLLRRSPHRAGLALLGVWTAGLLVAGVFPADPPGMWDRPSTADMVHGLAAWLALAVFPIAAVLLRHARTVAIASAVTTAILAVFMVDVMGGPSLPPLLGLVERVVIVVNLLWLALAVRTAVRPQPGRRQGRSRPAAAARPLSRSRLKLSVVRARSRAMN